MEMQEYNVNQFIDNSRFSKFHIHLIGLGLFLIAFTGYGASIYGSILPLITKEWNVEPTKLGFVGSVAEFGTMFGALFLSYISERFGAKKLLISSVLLFSIFTFAQSMVDNINLFAICRFIAGVGFGGVIPIVISLLTEYAPKNSKSKSVAIALCGNQVGSIIAPLIAIIVIPQLGWRPVLWMALIPILFLVFVIKYVPESAQFLLKTNRTKQLKAVLQRINKEYDQVINVDQILEKNKKNIEENKKISYLRLFNKDYYVITILSCLIYIMGLLFINGVIIWLPDLMVRSGYPLTSSLAFGVFLNIGTIAGTATWSVIADKKGFAILLPVIYSIGAISLMLLGIKANIVILYLLVVLIGFFLFAAHSLVNAFVSQHYPHEIRSTAVGFPNSMGRIGGILGPIVGGSLLSANASISIWFMTFGATGLVAAISFVIINFTIKRKSADLNKINTVKNI
ncbi:MFS transporter [Niallia sp. Man26]|uniref:MFS transporter n=1 Tax=Niallia sp. Man26 TaxID=2912824 RepID=UPI001EDB99B2|nr:MFS transporter [Niallia sp. Man26]UPO91072.1 MFS transporter [Niallia sp. Man26]